MSNPIFIKSSILVFNFLSLYDLKVSEKEVLKLLPENNCIICFFPSSISCDFMHFKAK